MDMMEGGCSVDCQRAVVKIIPAEKCYVSVASNEKILRMILISK